jgi:hypothetical protein
MPTLHCEQTTYQEIERVSKEKCRSIDGHHFLRHKRLHREPFHKGIAFEEMLGPPASPNEVDLRSSRLMRFSRETTQGVKYGVGATAVFVGLLGSVMLGPSCAHARAEIDPDQFDSPNTEPIPQPRTADSKVAVTRYDRAFPLSNSVLCNETKLAPGRYSIWLRSNGKVGQATLNQKGHAIEIAVVVQTEAPEQRDEVVIVENNKNGRTLPVRQQMLQ